ncbi:MAG TPA: DUF3800 domain-containing protein [Pyrinomonadaceae bacterium]
MDETGRSEDLSQKFVGMAGLFAPSKNWEKFEKQWKETLEKFDIPFFHMKDFAHSTGFFKEWKGDEIKRRQLFGELMRTIKQNGALPFGCTIPLDYYRQHPQYLQDANKNPYYLAFMFCALLLSYMVEPFREDGETIAPVFAEQTEFQHEAMRFYQGLKRNGTISDLLDFPVFRPMQKFVPLQAADLVAYEVHKEAGRRLYKPHEKPRWGWTELDALSGIGREIPRFVFQTEQNVVDFMIGVKRGIENKILGRKSL